MSEKFPSKSEAVFNAYELIRPIEELGTFSFDPANDESSRARTKYESIKTKIIELLSIFAAHEAAQSLPPGYVMEDSFRDAKSYLEGRLRAVEQVLGEVP